ELYRKHNNLSVSSKCSTGEAPDRRSKVTAERVALLVLSALLAAALIVIYRLCDFYCFKVIYKQLQWSLYSNLFIDDTCPKCEEGWELHGGKCYYFSTSKSTWDQSRDDCRRGGGDLVKIDSREEQVENTFWIGLTDSKEEGKWLWVDDSPLNTSLAFWSGTEPDNWPGKGPEGEDCARMGKKSGADDLKCWFDVPCKISYKSICEKSPLTELQRR
uniref:C-type lectin domain-containing protein n=1 Tax=Anabas testudineus TaxID=64144 RepID=A0AAQ6IG33_ANATE